MCDFSLYDIIKFNSSRCCDCRLLFLRKIKAKTKLSNCPKVWVLSHSCLQHIKNMCQNRIKLHKKMHINNIRTCSLSLFHHSSLLWLMFSQWCHVEMNILVSGLPAESPDTMEPSSQFDESLHSLKRGKKDKKVMTCHMVNYSER